MTSSLPGPIRGAVDLSSLAQPRPPASTPGAPAAAGGAAGYAIDVTEQSFQDVVQSSMSHVVVLCLWSPRSPQSAAYNDQVGAVVDTYEGKIQLARVDVDANPQIAQALQIQAVPVLVGLVSGQPVPLMQGTADDAQLRQVFDELTTIAVQNGLTGRAPVTGSPAPLDDAAEPEPVDDPRFAAADAALAADDLEGAVAEYTKLKAQHPADVEIGERLAGVSLMARTRGADLQTARQEAGDRPDDVDAQLLVADLDVSGGHVDDAFDRVIQLIKRLPADERDPVRERLLDLFTVVGVSDPRVATARRALAAALY